MVLVLLLGKSWATDQRELTIKAAYLFRLSLFVEWPAHRLEENGTEPLFFCIAGNPDVSLHLATVLADKFINRHKILVTGVDLKDDLSVCHLLYLPAHLPMPQRFLQASDAYPILTIGESENFYRKGGMILLFNKNNTIKFAINEQAAKEKGLKLRAQLLNLADHYP